MRFLIYKSKKKKFDLDVIWIYYKIFDIKKVRWIDACCPSPRQTKKKGLTSINKCIYIYLPLNVFLHRLYELRLRLRAFSENIKSNYFLTEIIYLFKHSSVHSRYIIRGLEIQILIIHFSHIIGCECSSRKFNSVDRNILLYYIQ
jgi:hypothetical protein